MFGHSYCLGIKGYPGNFYNPLGLTQGGYKSYLGNIFHPSDSYDPCLGNPLLFTAGLNVHLDPFFELAELMVGMCYWTY